MKFKQFKLKLHNLLRKLNLKKSNTVLMKFVALNGDYHAVHVCIILYFIHKTYIQSDSCKLTSNNGQPVYDIDTADVIQL